MLQAVHSGFYCCLDSIYSIGVAHNGKAFFMCDMHHLTNLFFIQRGAGHLSLICKIQKSGSHDLNKISALPSGFQNKIVEFF